MLVISVQPKQENGPVGIGRDHGKTGASESEMKRI
jgi:hypothetical protein